MRTPLTAARLRQHFGYGWWKYVLALVLTLGLLNLFFAMTGPRVPDNQRVELFVYGAANEDIFNAYLEDVRVRKFPVQQQFTASVFTDLNEGMAAMGTRVLAGDGELFLLTNEVYRSYAEQGVLVPLDDHAEVITELRGLGISTDDARSQGPDGTLRVYGINVRALPVMESWLYDRSQDHYLCIRVANGNDDTALSLFLWMAENLREAAGVLEIPSAQ